MNVISKIKSLLPPTSRACQSQFSSISQQQEQLIQSIDRLSAEVAELKDENRILKQFRYINLEYLVGSPEDHPRILIAGWYGAENFGDELMLRTILDCMPPEMLSHIAVMLWDSPDYPINLINPKVKIIHYPSTTWEIDQLVSNYDALVWGGGAIIDDTQFSYGRTNIRTGNLFIHLSSRMIANRKSVYCLGLSANEKLNNSDYIARLNELVDGSRLFSLRDPYSKECLIQAGINGSGIELCEDLAFASHELAKAPKRTRGRTNHRLRIAFVPLVTDYLFDYYIGAIHELGSTLRSMGIKSDLHLIPFAKRDATNGGFLDRLSLHVSGFQTIHVKPYTNSILEIDFASYDLVIAYKYHAALISLIQQVPTIIVYDEAHPHYRNKMTHLAQLLNQSAPLSSSNFEAHLDRAIEDSLNHIPDSNTCKLLLETQRTWLSNTCAQIARDCALV